MTNKSSKSASTDEIDANLRRVYEDVLNQELPDRFHDLLNRLRSGDATVPDQSADRGDA